MFQVLRPLPDEPDQAVRYGTAGELAVTDVPHAEPGTTAGDARASLHGRAFTSATEVAVLDGERLVGLVAVERLLAAVEETPVSDLVDAPVVVTPDTDLEAATRAVAKSGQRTVAVVDSGERFHGVVPSNRLLGVLELEHEEDLARLGGFLSQAAVARTASEEAVGRRLWHRLPWLGLGLAGAMASALIVGSFEEQLQEQVLLAFFVPAVVYMADAVGTQTETIMIRAMSMGIRIRRLVLRELVTGLAIGLLISAAFFPFALAVWGDAGVAGAVAVALLVSCTVATLVAMALPYALARLGRDPAFGSGPLATVIQDLLSILAYFGAATLLAF